MSARERILGRLRAASGGLAPCLPDVAGHFSVVRAHTGQAQRTAAFRSRIEASHAEVHAASFEDWPRLLAELCRQKGVKMLACPPAGDIARALAGAAGLPCVLPFEDDFEVMKARLFDEVDAAITRAHGAIAETGTLIAWPGPDEPRSLSLVPPIHFVLLDAAAIHADLHEAMTAQGWAGRLPTNLLLISGPSKTADIQQTLAYGAHGPKELIVLLLSREEASA